MRVLDPFRPLGSPTLTMAYGLFAPGDISKLGPVEQWTYKVVFVIIGETVTLQATGNPGRKQ